MQSAVPGSTQPWCPLCQFLQQRLSWRESKGGSLVHSPSCWERNSFSIIIILSPFQCLSELVTPRDPSLFMNGLLYRVMRPLNGLHIRCLMLGQTFHLQFYGVSTQSLELLITGLTPVLQPVFIAKQRVFAHDA